jgi:hypothetical protein
LRNTLQSKIVAVVLGPVGASMNLKLNKHADKIDGYLAKGNNKVAIAKLLDVSPNTLYEWLKVRRPSSTPAP